MKGSGPMTEEMLVQGAHDVEKRIKRALLDRDMKQVDVARALHLNPQLLNRAIKGDMTPKSIKIREQLKKFLDY